VPVCVWLTTTASLLPPVCKGEPVTVVLAYPPSSWKAPITNLLRKSGVLFDPLHNSHPTGIVARVPDHIIIPPEGKAALAAVVTKAVLATCKVLVPAAAVGVVGIPVKLVILY
jgi:hypothetical protein